MEEVVAMGLNLAVLYGFGLIIVALILAVIYNAACMKEEKRLEGSAGGEG
jgi:protein-S-isoprenylcysteine O-methyltransferase Ste14